MKIISFFTDDEYKKYAERLKKSVSDIGYKIQITFAPIKTWPEAIKYKTALILKHYKRCQPLLYLDADCEVVGSLAPLIKIAEEYDIAIRHRNLADRYNAGVILFGKDKQKILPILKEWKDLTYKEGLNYIAVDQKPLQITVGNHPELKIYDLPCYFNFLTYDELPENGGHSLDDAHILHHKVSKINNKARAWRKFKQGYRESY